MMGFACASDGVEPFFLYLNVKGHRRHAAEDKSGMVFIDLEGRRFENCKWVLISILRPWISQVKLT
jgi:hypothetical protein